MYANLQRLIALCCLSGLTLLSAADKYIYWAEQDGDQAIKRLNLTVSGSTAEVIVDYPNSSPRDVAVDHVGGHIYWLDAQQARIGRSNFDGSSPISFVDLANAPRALRNRIGGNMQKLVISELPGERTLYVSSSPGNITAIELDRTASRRVTSLAGTIGLDIDATTNEIYYVTSRPSGRRADSIWVQDRFQRASRDHVATLLNNSATSPAGMVVDPDAARPFVYIAILQNQNNLPTSIIRYNVDTGDMVSVVDFTPGLGATDVALDAETNQLYIALARGQIWRANLVDYAGVPLTTSEMELLVDTPGTRIEGLGFLRADRPTPIPQPVDSTPYIFSGESLNDGDLYRFNLISNQVETMIADEGHIDGVTYDPLDQKVYWYQVNLNAILRSNIDGSDRELLATDLPFRVRDMDVDALNKKLYIGSSNRFWRINADGSAETSGSFGPTALSSLPQNTITGVELDRENNRLFYTWFARGGGGSSRRVSFVRLDDFTHEIVSDSLLRANDVVYDPASNKVHVTNLARGDLPTVRSFEVATGALEPTVGNLDEGFGIAIDRVNDLLYFNAAESSSAQKVLYRHDLRTGVTSSLGLLPGFSRKMELSFGSAVVDPSCRNQLQILPNEPLININSSGVVTVTLSVNAQDAISGLQVELQYDADLLDYTGATYGDFFNTTALVEIAPLVDEVAGHWKGFVSIHAPASPASGVGTYATLTFQAKGPLGLAAFDANAIFAGPGGSCYDDHCILPGSLTVDDGISGDASLSGSLEEAVYANGSRSFQPAAGATVYLQNTDTMECVQVQTDTNGQFLFSSIRAGNYNLSGESALTVFASEALTIGIAEQVVLNRARRLHVGDVNDDNTIDQTDIGLIQALVGFDSGDPEYDPLMDLSKDGRIRNRDVNIASRREGDSAGCN